MNYINILPKINNFSSKMADSNYSDIHSLYHSNYSSTNIIFVSALMYSVSYSPATFNLTPELVEPVDMQLLCAH